ncbi:MAG TPA: branched-chain amino acid ABC transporter substrate-binding protein [Methylomirabilota bacterium]|nr:branched-chain amino acid ABC transporter substrate-binding protein [Methylomirabilota bacterium]
MRDRGRMTAVWVVALGLALIVGAGPAAAQQVVKIAAGVPLTGPLAKQGQEVANAVKLAADEWNRKGGVLGKKIEVLEADDQGNPQVGVAAAEKVAADSAVLGAVWGITSVTCIPVSEVLERVNVVLISPGCTNPKVTDRGLKNTNRVCARDDAQGPAGAMFAVQDLKAKKIAIFDDGTTGPKGAADEVEKTAKKLGATPLRYVIRSGDKDFRAILATIPKDVNVIYASLWAPDAALIAKQLPDVGLNVRMIGPDGQYEPVDYIQAAGGAAEGNYVTFLAPDLKKIPSAAAFVKAFEAKYGPASSYGPLAYEAANIILEAIKKVGKADRAAVRDAVRATKNYKGILGVPITFDDKGDVAGGVIFVYQVKGTGFEQVKTIVVK